MSLDGQNVMLSDGMKSSVFFIALACGLGHAQTAPTSAFLTTSDGVKLHYLEQGQGSTILFVPGLAMPADVWDAQIRYFAGSHRVVALDPRSQGDSAKPSFGHDPGRRGRD